MYIEVVPQIHIGFEGRQGRFPDLGQGQHHLQPGPVAFLESSETKFPPGTHQHHATGHADLVRGLFSGGQIGIGSPQLRQSVGYPHLYRIGIRPTRQQTFAFFGAHPDLLGGVIRPVFQVKVFILRSFTHLSSLNHPRANKTFVYWLSPLPLR